MTTYDDIFKSFNTMTLVDNYYLPNSDDSLYALIEGARRLYNMTLYTNIVQDDILEQLSVDLNDLQMLLFCRCMKLIVLENMATEFSSMVATASKDNALKDYKAQVDSRHNLVVNERKEISRLSLSLLSLDIGDVNV